MEVFVETLLLVAWSTELVQTWRTVVCEGWSFVCSFSFVIFEKGGGCMMVVIMAVVDGGCGDGRPGKLMACVSADGE